MRCDARLLVLVLGPRGATDACVCVRVSVQDYTPPTEKDPFDELAESWGVVGSNATATQAPKAVVATLSKPVASPAAPVVAAPAVVAPVAAPVAAPVIAPVSAREKGNELDLDDWIRQIEDVVIETNLAPAKAAAPEPVKAAPVWAPVKTVAAPEPVKTVAAPEPVKAVAAPEPPKATAVASDGTWACVHVSLTVYTCVCVNVDVVFVRVR